MGQAADTYLRHPYAYTSFEMARSPIDYADIDGGTHVRIFSHTFLKKTDFSKIFRALSEGSRGSTPASPDSTPRATYPGIFSRLPTSELKGFTQALPTSNVTPTPTPRSDSPPRVTYLRIFSRLSTSILTLAFTQALPTSNVTPTPTPPSDPRIFARLSTSILTDLTKGFSQALTTSNVTPTPIKFKNE